MCVKTSICPNLDASRCGSQVACAACWICWTLNFQWICWNNNLLETFCKKKDGMIKVDWMTGSVMSNQNQHLPFQKPLGDPGRSSEVPSPRFSKHQSKVWQDSMAMYSALHLRSFEASKLAAWRRWHRFCGSFWIWNPFRAAEVSLKGSGEKPFLY